MTADMTRPPPVLVQELKEAARSAEATGIQLLPDERNVFHWRALLKVQAAVRAVCACRGGARQAGCGRPHAGRAVDSPPPHPLQGPCDTPYEGGVFELAIVVPEQYPLVAPAGAQQPFLRLSAAGSSCALTA